MLLNVDEKTYNFKFSVADDQPYLNNSKHQISCLKNFIKVVSHFLQSLDIISPKRNVMSLLDICASFCYEQFFDVVSNFALREG
jgi:hypothetical protein